MNTNQPSEQSAVSSPVSVLTVDDSASMRALMRAALTSSGFKVEQAEDGQEALEWLATNEVDVVLMDINMPRLDGFGLIVKLRETALHADRPILVLTTESSDEKKMRAKNAGAAKCGAAWKSSITDASAWCAAR